jgi:hypothetical protein
MENELMQVALPVLPKKRWFEKQRWLNRFTIWIANMQYAA